MSRSSSLGGGKTFGVSFSSPSRNISPVGLFATWTDCLLRCHADLEAQEVSRLLEDLEKINPIKEYLDYFVSFANTLLPLVERCSWWPGSMLEERFWEINQDWLDVRFGRSSQPHQAPSLPPSGQDQPREVEAEEAQPEVQYGMDKEGATQFGLVEPTSEQVTGLEQDGQDHGYQSMLSPTPAQYSLLLVEESEDEEETDTTGHCQGELWWDESF